MQKQIVSISGGIGSFEVLTRLLDKHSVDDIVAVFCDTKMEDADLYRFLDETEKVFGVNIIRLVDGRTPWELSFQNKFLFNSRVAPCSRVLKSEIFTKWLKESYQPDECVIHFGIDFTESHRQKAIIRNYAPYQVDFILCEPPYKTKDEMIESLKNYGIEIPRLYKLGFSHNNCGGFCFKAGIGHFKNLLDKDREFYLENESKEEELRKLIDKDVAILKRKGKPYTLKELRESIENNIQLSFDELMDFGGCGCFVE